MWKITVWQVNRKCTNPNEVPDGNLFFNWLNLLDNTESWQSYVKTQHTRFFTEDEWKQFQKDSISRWNREWTKQVTGMLMWYIPYLKDTWFIRTIDGKQQGLFSEYWEQMFNDFLWVKIRNVEYNKNLFYSMFDDSVTHWTLLGKIKWNFLKRIISDKEYAEKVFGASIDEVTYNNFAILYNKKNIYSFLPDEAKNILWKQTYLLFGENWERLNTPVIAQLTTEYLDNLSVSKQLQQIEYSLWHSLWTFQKFWYYIKKSVYWINNVVYKFFKFITAPWAYSTLLSIWWWLAWLWSLIILNSAMYLSDIFQHKKNIKWDRDKFFKKIWIDDWLNRIDLLWISFWTWVKHIWWNFKSLLQSWLFNVADKLAESSYKKRVVQDFLMQLFPWVTDLNAIEALLDHMKETNLAQYEQIITAIHSLIDESQLKQRGQQSIFNTSAKTQVWVLTPLKEVWHILYNFFANWWRGKTRWAIKIIKDCLDWKHFKWFAKYIDDMYAEGKDIDYILWEYNRIQFDLSELQYFVQKVAMVFLMSKYCVRIMWTDDNESETFFSSFNEYLDYVKIFDGNVAALETLPEFKIAYTMLKTFFDEQELWATAFDLTATTSINTIKQMLNIVTRWLYWPKISIETISQINRDRDKEEKHWFSYLRTSIQDNCAWFMYYLKSTIDDWLTDYYFPAWPKRILKEFFGIQSKEIEYINDEKNSLKLLKAVNSKENFTDWVLYNFPFIRQWSSWQFDESDQEFIRAVNDFKDSKAYHEFINNRFPIDMTDDDWLFTYNTITKRIQNKEWAIQDNIYTLYQYTDKDTNEIKTSKDMQLQENIIDYCMRHWLTKEQIENFQEQLKSSNKVYNDEAIKTLAYLEANEPWAWLQALAYIMQREQIKETYKWTNEDTSDEEIKARRKQAEIDVAKKYAKYILQVDKQRSAAQIILNYAKTHWYYLGKYISWTDDTNYKNTYIIDGKWSYSSLFNDTFKAQLVTDVMAAEGNINAYKVKNAYWKIYDISKIYDDNWNIDKTMAKYMLNSLNAVYDHIDHLAISEEEERVLKQWALMFNEEFIDYIIHNDNAMKDEWVKTAVNDWLHYRYKEFDELNDLAEKYAEEQLEEKEFKIYMPKHWNNKYNKYGRWWYRKYRGQSYYRWRYNYYNKRWLSNRYNTMKNKAYWDRFNYRIYNWKPTQHNVDYLSETDYYNIQELMKNLRTAVWAWWSWWSKKKWSWWTEWPSIWVSSKRGKAFQFYKMEDPNKPVEYVRPWRARFVKKWKWYEPIKTTTWKMLQK